VEILKPLDLYHEAILIGRIRKGGEIEESSRASEFLNDRVIQERTKNNFSGFISPRNSSIRLIREKNSTASPTGIRFEATLIEPPSTGKSCSLGSAVLDVRPKTLSLAWVPNLATVFLLARLSRPM
jgi:hypothetical protein